MRKTTLHSCHVPQLAGARHHSVLEVLAQTQHEEQLEEHQVGCQHEGLDRVVQHGGAAVLVVEVAEKLQRPRHNVDGGRRRKDGAAAVAGVERAGHQADGGQSRRRGGAGRSVEQHVVEGVDADDGPGESERVHEHECRGKDERDAVEVDAHVAAVHVVGLVVGQLEGEVQELHVWLAAGRGAGVGAAQRNQSSSTAQAGLLQLVFGHLSRAPAPGLRSAYAPGLRFGWRGCGEWDEEGSRRRRQEGNR